MDEKIREAAIVKAAYFAAKRRDNTLKQERLAQDLGVTQGLVTQWLHARARIPNDTLLRLSKILGFDALEVRPSIKDSYDLATEVITTKAVANELAEEFSQLTQEELREVKAFADFVKGRRS